jgi:hypothetical protein
MRRQITFTVFLGFRLIVEVKTFGGDVNGTMIQGVIGVSA